MQNKINLNSLLQSPLPQQYPCFGRNAVCFLFDIQLQHRIHLPTFSEGPSFHANRSPHSRHPPSVNTQYFRAVNNQFLVRTKHHIAVTYNGKSFFTRLICIGKLQSHQLFPTHFPIQSVGKLLERRLQFDPKIDNPDGSFDRHE